MRHNLNIRVSDKPKNGGVVACRTVSIREKLFTLLLGSKQKVMVVVPGNSVESIAITEVPMGGGIHEYYYDAAAIAEPVAASTPARMKRGFGAGNKYSADIPGQKHQHLNDHRPNGYADEDIPQLRNKRDVWQINTVPYKGGHFAAFPPKLAETCLLAGCPPGGVVLDPFLGSGTTAAVAKQLGRHYIGIELNPEYCTLAEKRIGGEVP